MKQKFKRLIPMTLLVKHQISLVENSQMTKEEAFDNIQLYNSFLSQELTIDMVIGEKAIFKGFLSKFICTDGSGHYFIKGNKEFTFYKRKDGLYVCRQCPSIECLLRYDAVDVVDSCLSIDLKIKIQGTFF